MRRLHHPDLPPLPLFPAIDERSQPVQCRRNPASVVGPVSSQSHVSVLNQTGQVQKTAEVHAGVAETLGTSPFERHSPIGLKFVKYQAVAGFSTALTVFFRRKREPGRYGSS